MGDIGLTGALVGGVLTLLSPCSVMLLPAFFSYAFTSPGKLLARTGAFYLGLLATLVPLGVLAGVLGSLVLAHRSTVMTVAATLVIIFGLIQVAGLPMPGFLSAAPMEGTSPIAVFLLGTVYGLAGVCAGPILGAVLTLAAMGGDPLYGGLVLAVFAAGMTVPLLVFAFLWSRFEGFQAKLRPKVLTIGKWQNAWTQIVGGLLAIGVGVFLLITGGVGNFGFMTTKDQYQVETWALSATSRVSDWAFLIAAVSILIIVFGFNHFRKKKARSKTALQVGTSISIRSQ